MLIQHMVKAATSAGLDAVQVADNPGLPIAVLDRSLDYLVRISDKAHSVSPSRCQRIIETDYADSARIRSIRSQNPLTGTRPIARSLTLM